MDLRQIRYFVALPPRAASRGESLAARVAACARAAGQAARGPARRASARATFARGDATKAGAVFHRHAVTILEDVERARRAVPVQGRAADDVLIGVTPNTARHIVPDLLEECARCTVAAGEDHGPARHSAEMLEEVESRTLDMAFCYDQPKSDRLGALALYGEDLVLLGPTELMNGSGDVELRDLPSFPLIMSGPARRACFRRGCGRALRSQTEHST